VSRAVEIYNRGIHGPETTDADLLSKRARAYESLKNWEGRRGRTGSRARNRNPGRRQNCSPILPRRLATRRPRAAVGDRSVWRKLKRFYEGSLALGPWKNDVVATGGSRNCS